MVNCSDPEKEAERRRKIGDANRGRVATDSTKEKMSKVRKGRPHSKEHSENIGKALKGRVITPEWREKLRVAALNRKLDPETKERMKKKMSMKKQGENNSFFGKTHTEETKIAIGQNTSKNLIETGRSAGENNPMYGKSGCLNPAWRGGTSFYPYCYKFNERRKAAVRKFFKNLCICCGKHSEENMFYDGTQRDLDIHHIDHDKEQGCKGKPFNLVPMCMSCHGKEQHYEEEYTKYINKTIEEGFKWGIWSREQYQREVMYPEN